MAEVSLPEESEERIGTPEGDNEFEPGEPLSHGEIPEIEVPRGNEPHPSQPIRPAM